MMQNRKYYLYTLSDPTNGTVRYVGVSIDPNKRLKQHLRMEGGSRRKIQWISSLISLNKRPILTVVNCFDSVEDAKEAESSLYFSYCKNELFCDSPKSRFYNPKPERKEEAKHLSFHIDSDIIDKLKAICEAEKRSQAKTIEVLIEEKHKRLKR